MTINNATKMKRIRLNVAHLDQHMDDEEVRHDHPLKDGLPWQAFAIATDKNDLNTWKLPHHTKLVKKAVKGKIGHEHTVDWKLVEEAVQLLSLRGREGQRVNATEGEVLHAAHHLATHYQKAGLPLPDALAVLV
jgi:hypothetical protein